MNTIKNPLFINCETNFSPKIVKIEVCKCDQEDNITKALTKRNIIMAFAINVQKIIKGKGNIE